MALRVAFFVQAFPSLSETFILNRITALMDRGCDVRIVAERPGREGQVHPAVARYDLLSRTEYWGVPASLLLRGLKGAGVFLAGLPRAPLTVLRSLNAPRYGPPAAALTLLHAAARPLEDPAYDIVHAHFGPAGQVAVALRELGLLHGKVVTSFYGHDLTKYPRRFGRGVYRHLFRHGDLFLPLCDRFRDRLLELGCPEERVAVHHLGVDCDQFSPARRRREQGAIRVLTIARLVEKKGVEYGIRAVACLARRGPCVEYTIVGDGPLRRRLARLVDELGVADRVRLLGWMHQGDLAGLLERSDILLAPSVTARDGDQEGTPTVLLEAAAMGLPVVSTHHSGIPEIVRDGVSGFLVRERDVSAIAERLSELIESAERREAMGLAGRQLVRESFDVATLSDELLHLYQGLLSEGPAGGGGV